MDALLDKLTEAQQQAVQHIDGPLLILAGPGSGKTRVVTHRIAHLLRSGIPDYQILALTFTNKAADEMRARVDELSPGHAVWLSTFHRFGTRLLRKYGDYVGLAPNFTIYDTSDARQTIKRVIEAASIKTMNYTPERIAAAISDAKNALLTPDEYAPRPGSPLSHVVAEVYPAYQQRLQASAAADFDDLLLLVAKLLYNNPEIRATLDKQYKYILVDEYQDTNRAQYVILRALSVDYPNLAVTGDPDQSIYGWRGADLGNILEFERDFPSVRIVRLEQNYRSTKRILRVADQLIGHNVRRKQKDLYTHNDEGVPVRLAAYADQDHEAAGIVEQICAGIERGRKPSDFAVFYRVNALSRSLEKAFREALIPFQIVRGQEFYERKEIKDVLAYCQLVNNPRDDVAFERTVNTPPRGIGQKTVERLGAEAYRRGVSLLEVARDAHSLDSLSKQTAAKVERFVEIVDRIGAVAHGDVEEVIGTVLEASGYRLFLSESETEEDLNRLANIEELLTDARQFDERNPGDGHLEEYLEYTWLVSDTDDWDTETDKVTLMTLHAAKGLEFAVVYLVAVEHGLLPHERSSLDADELEEERRLAFVGITRAKEELQLSYAVRRDFRGQRRLTIPSSFLMEMPRHEMEMFQEELPTWDEMPHGDDFGAEEPDAQWEIGNIVVEADAGTEPAIHIAAAKITTAAALADDLGGYRKPANEPTVSPEVFALGMAVMHPEFGPGKITALSGSGKNRRATIQFAKAGQKKFVLAHSAVRPVR